MAETGEPAFVYPTATLPRVLSTGIFHNPSGAHWQERTLETLSVNFAVCGAASCLNNGKPMRILAGHAYTWQPGDVFRGEVDEQLTSLYVRFSWPEWYSGMAGSNGISLPRDIALSPSANRQLKETFNLLIESAMTKLPSWDVCASGYLQVLLSILVREFSAASNSAKTNVAIDRRLGLALAYIDSTLESRPSIGEIAKHARLSEDHFRRLFRKSMGLSPIQYLNHIRAQEGRRLLSEDPGITANVAAERAGFVDVRHFSRVFQQHYNLTPAEYRQSLTYSVSSGPTGI